MVSLGTRPNFTAFSSKGSDEAVLHKLCASAMHPPHKTLLFSATKLIRVNHSTSKEQKLFWWLVTLMPRTSYLIKTHTQAKLESRAGLLIRCVFYFHFWFFGIFYTDMAPKISKQVKDSLLLRLSSRVFLGKFDRYCSKFMPCAIS